MGCIQQYWGSWPMSLQDLYHICRVIPIRELAGNCKKTNITVVFKKSKREEPGSCGLVSLTLVLQEAMEQTQWKPFPNSWMTRQWSGTAIRNLPRASSLLENHDEKASSVNKERTEVVVLDFSKGPDPICHSVIIGKSVTYGLDKKTTKWMEIWKDLWQVVCDIPQGLILAPKLWNNFINDMEYEMKCTLRKWAMVHMLEGRAASVI